MKTIIVDIKSAIFLFILISILHHTAMTQESSKNSGLKYTPIENVKWNMFNPIRITIQDFAVTDKYNDTVSGNVDGKFLDLANLNYGIGFYQNFSKKIAISAEFMFGYGYLSKKYPSLEDKARAWSETIRTDLYYHFFKQEMQMEPYLFIGMHGSYKMGNIYVSTPVGFGARYFMLKKNAMINTQVGYGIGLTNGVRNSVIYSTGFYYSLKKK